MPYDALQKPLNHVRRADRTVTDEVWIADLLHRAAIGYLATQHDGQPFINSNLFVFDEAAHTIYMHSARTGRTHDVIAAGGGPVRVCFTTTEMGRLLPAAVAVEFSVEYAGVVVFGEADVLTDTEAATRALQLLLDKYFGHLRAGIDYRPPVVEELARTAVYAIRIESWSGKRKQVAEDFPGAFFFGNP
jgi:hypothetical protein